MGVELIVGSLSLIAVISGFFEWRVRTLYTQMKEKIEDKEKINRVVQDELKNDIKRLEAKIDMLIKLNLRDHK